MNIFILEDDFLFQEKIRKAIIAYLENSQLPCKKLVVSSNPADILENITQITRNQIYFLNILGKRRKYSGIEVAKKIREIDPVGRIVFISTQKNTHEVIYNHKLAILDCIDKKQGMTTLKKKIAANLDYMLENYEHTGDYFVFQTVNDTIKLPFSEILYFETSITPRHVLLYTKKKKIEFKARLKEIEKMDSRLVVCHKSFVLNTQSILHIDKKKRIAYFNNNKSCPVSRGKLTGLLEILA